MKVIKINTIIRSCSECVYFDCKYIWNTMYSSPICNKLKKELYLEQMTLGECTDKINSTVPDWCPLEDK